MASLTSVTVLYSDTAGNQKTVLYRLFGVNTGDTIDVSTVGPVLFKKIDAACFVASDLHNSAVAAVAGTVLTLTLASMALDTVDLLIVGE